MASVKNCTLVLRHCSPTGGGHNNGYISELQRSKFCRFHLAVLTSPSATFIHKGALRGRRFGSDESGRSGEHVALRATKTFFSSGVRTLVDGFKKCVELRGEYVEK